MELGPLGAPKTAYQRSEMLPELDREISETMAQMQLWEQQAAADKRWKEQSERRFKVGETMLTHKAAAAFAALLPLITQAAHELLLRGRKQ